MEGTPQRCGVDLVVNSCFAAVLCGGKVCVVCVVNAVCGTEVEEQAACVWSEHEGERFYFCSRTCKMEFDDNPFSYSRGRL